MFNNLFLIPALMSILIAAIGCSSHSRPKTKPLGKNKMTSTRALEKGAQILQSNAPVASMDVHMVGFHPMKDHPSHQMEAHHFCKEMNEEFSQCALFDGNTKDANLNGVEYIISERLFNDLPENEKKYWHPHNYEILSGQLVAPGLPEVAETSFMKKKMNSYGKTWHLWNTGHHTLSDATQMPIGEPMLAWSFNRDGEILPGLEKKTEKTFDFNMKDKREDRKELIKEAKPQRGVDSLKAQFAGDLRPIDGVIDSQQAQEEKN
jgi:hypothetical protein